MQGHIVGILWRPPAQLVIYWIVLYYFALLNFSQFSAKCTSMKCTSFIRIIIIPTDRSSRGHSYKVYIPQSRIDVCKYFFSRRVIHCWNTLPAYDEDFSCLSSFKRLLDRTDKSLYIAFCMSCCFCFYFIFLCLSQCTA